MTLGNHIEIKSDAQFQEVLATLKTSSTVGKNARVLNFWAPWMEACTHLNEVFLDLSKKYPELLFFKIEAEAASEVAEKYEIAAVPTFILAKDDVAVDRVDGANAALLSSKVAAFAAKAGLAPVTANAAAPAASVAKLTTPTSDQTQTPSNNTLLAPIKPPRDAAAIDAEIAKILSSNRIILFMKGSPDAPRCGFSRQAIAILNGKNVEFGHFDILQDEEIRQAMKAKMNWPTYPMCIVDGELIGGLDIMKEMDASGDLEKVLKP